MKNLSQHNLIFAILNNQSDIICIISRSVDAWLLTDTCGFWATSSAISDRSAISESRHSESQKESQTDGKRGGRQREISLKWSASGPTYCHRTLCSSLITKDRHVMRGTVTVYHALSTWQAEGWTHLSTIYPVIMLFDLLA